MTLDFTNTIIFPIAAKFKSNMDLYEDLILSISVNFYLTNLLSFHFLSDQEYPVLTLIFFKFCQILLIVDFFIFMFVLNS